MADKQLAELLKSIEAEAREYPKDEQVSATSHVEGIIASLATWVANDPPQEGDVN
jgi:hypothetical protein